MGVFLKSKSLAAVPADSLYRRIAPEAGPGSASDLARLGEPQYGSELPERSRAPALVRRAFVESYIVS